MNKETAKIISDKNVIKEVISLKSKEEINNRLLEKGTSLTK